MLDFIIDILEIAWPLFKLGLGAVVAFAALYHVWVYGFMILTELAR